MRISWRLVAASAALLAVMLVAPAAEAAIPAGLKTSCTVRNPHPGFSYRFCDDGLPPSGGTTANTGGVSAITVPAKYDGWQGLPAKAGDATSVPGADANGDIALDVDVSLPSGSPPAGGWPMVVMMHGCCSGNKTSWEATSFDTAGERWHYSNAWFASRGYVVVNYTSRGFVSGETSGNRGSTGETQLDSRRYEINDFQHLAGQIADDSFFGVDPQKIVTTGGSYGGGLSWLALTDPIWNSPGGTPMKLAASAPKYGWTDLVYSLVPTGKHFQTPYQLPATSGADSMTPVGIPKESIVDALYDSGSTGIPPGSAHATFASAVDEAFLCLQSGDPFESNPVCTNTIASTLPEFISDRSAYYQNDFFASIASDPNYRIPVFNAATFTDPLFTPVENLRMSNRLQSTVTGYPIQQYFGDYQHFVQNKAKEWGDICGANRHVCAFADYPGGDVNATPAGHARTGVTTRLNRFIDHYAAPSGNPAQAQPSFDVTASLQVCPDNAPALGQPADEPGPTFTANSYDTLTNGVFLVSMGGTQVTVNNASPNDHAGRADPLLNSIVNGGRCPVETTPAGPGVATYESGGLDETVTMIGATKVSIDYSATTSSGLQLNSRLYDVFPDGKAVMVDRGVRRVDQASGTVEYQLHGNGWRFQPDHKIRIEIAQDDAPYLKASNVASSTTITGVRLQIPTVETFGYPRPQGAINLRVPLAIAYQQCALPGNRTHGPALSFPSCSPATQTSSHLTAGTNDANGQSPKFNGSVRYQVLPGNPGTPADEADVRLILSASDVRNKVGLGDYAGQLQANATLRITDRGNGPTAEEPGTVSDVPFPFTAPCSTTPGDATVGSNCSVDTTADAVMAGAVIEGNRSIWELARIEVFDGGPDGLASTSPNTLFATQGIFVP